MKILKGLYRGVDHFTNIAIFVLLASMVINTTVSVFFRYVLNNAIFWSEEASRYLMIWMGFFGMSLATRDREHVGITFVVDAMPPIGRFILRILSDLIVVAFLILLTILSIRQIIGSLGVTTAALMMPMAVPYASVTAGGVLMTLQAIKRTALMVVEEMNTLRAVHNPESGDA